MKILLADNNVITDVVYIGDHSRNKKLVITTDGTEKIVSASDIAIITDDTALRTDTRTVVLCRSCKHRNKKTNYCSLYKHPVKPYQFCSEGDTNSENKDY